MGSVARKGCTFCRTHTTQGWSGSPADSWAAEKARGGLPSLCPKLRESIPGWVALAPTRSPGLEDTHCPLPPGDLQPAGTPGNRAPTADRGSRPRGHLPISPAPSPLRPGCGWTGTARRQGEGREVERGAH